MIWVLLERKTSIWVLLERNKYTFFNIKYITFFSKLTRGKNSQGRVVTLSVTDLHYEQIHIENIPLKNEFALGARRK